MIDVESLDRPIYLYAGQTLENRRFVVSTSFFWTYAFAAIYASGADITIRNVELIGYDTWQSRWNSVNEVPGTTEGSPLGIPSACVGIRTQNTPRIRIENVTVSGFPFHGVNFAACDDGVFRNLRFTRVFAGMVDSLIGSFPYPRNARVLIENVLAWDLWGPAPGNWPGISPYPSQVRPGEYGGGDGVAVWGLDDSIVRNVHGRGEYNSALKLTNPKNVLVEDCSGSHIMVQGKSTLDNSIDTENGRDITLRRCISDKSLGFGETSEEGGNGFQFSWNIDNLILEDSRAIARGKDGHGIELAVDVDATIRRNLIEGWNQEKGGQPAYALHVDATSSYNSPLESNNVLINQTRTVVTP